MGLLNQPNPHNKKYGRAMSFPSALNKGGNQLRFDGNKAVNLLTKSAASAIPGAINQVSKWLGTETIDEATKNMKAFNINLSSTLKQQMLDDAFINYGRYAKRPSTKSSVIGLNGSEQSSALSEFHMPAYLLNTVNTYQWTFKNPIDELVGTEKTNDGKQSKGANVVYTRTKAVPSMFNPRHGIQTVGIQWNIPLTNDPANNWTGMNKDISDCSIKKLIALSNSGKLGSETFRLSDFLYCKDLGKVSNNHLITLRKFALPIGDHIGEGNGPRFRSQQADDPGINEMGDIAHLVTWFGTEDNKLEDIIKLTTEVEYIRKESQIQQEYSQEDSEARGILGAAINTFPSLGGNYYQHVAAGTAGTQNLYRMFLGSTISTKFNSYAVAKDSSQQLERFRNYDNNKVYEPMNTLREMWMPSGALKFNHEFTLTFCYELRAYENINPRSAFMDLIGNIYECVYNRGSWWGGQQKIIGPVKNGAAWRKAEAFLDNAWDRLGGLLNALAVGGGDAFKDLLGTIMSAVDKGAKQFAGMVESNGGGFGGVMATLGKGLQWLWTKGGFGQFSKSMLHNALGRPAFYAFNSLLTGEPTGVWHVTVGNPRAPILSMGNLRVTNSTFTMYGPLGMDGYPTKMKVTVSLAHCRPRDVSQVTQMFAYGLTSIYRTTSRRKLAKYYPTHGYEEPVTHAQNMEKIDAPSTQTSQGGGDKNNKGKDGKEGNGQEGNGKGGNRIPRQREVVQNADQLRDARDRAKANTGNPGGGGQATSANQNATDQALTEDQKREQAEAEQRAQMATAKAEVQAGMAAAAKEKKDHDTSLTAYTESLNRATRDMDSNDDDLILLNTDTSGSMHFFGDYVMPAVRQSLDETA